MPPLYLLRHGIAVPHGTPGVPEDDRPLTPAGEREVVLVARGLKQLGVDLERVVTSPLPRSRRTAKLTAEVLGLTDRLEVEDVLRPGTAAAAIRDWLLTRHQDPLMIVGHNPNLSDLLALLLGLPAGSESVGLKKAAVASLKGDAQGRYRLRWLAPPAMFRKLGD